MENKKNTLAAHLLVSSSSDCLLGAGQFLTMSFVDLAICSTKHIKHRRLTTVWYQTELRDTGERGNQFILHTALWSGKILISDFLPSYIYTTDTLPSIQIVLVNLPLI